MLHVFGSYDASLPNNHYVYSKRSHLQKVLTKVSNLARSTSSHDSSLWTRKMDSHCFLPNTVFGSLILKTLF